mmetsp:Transcript_25414/g.40636  ORF Transcript_25414/g.40636 Transcript_25414/m.40636 type:complete len:217 (+) Transcript_25414:319-969(+)
MLHLTHAHVLTPTRSRQNLGKERRLYPHHCLHVVGGDGDSVHRLVVGVRLAAHQRERLARRRVRDLAPGYYVAGVGVQRLVHAQLDRGKRRLHCREPPRCHPCRHCHHLDVLRCLGHLVPLGEKLLRVGHVPRLQELVSAIWQRQTLVHRTRAGHSVSQRQCRRAAEPRHRCQLEQHLHLLPGAQHGGHRGEPRAESGHRRQLHGKRGQIRVVLVA